MNRLLYLFAAITFVALSATSIPSTAAEMTFQLVNDSEWPVNMKLFSRGESHQEWPSRSKAFSLRPDTAVQQIKISCEAGEQICWGTWRTVQAVSGEVGAGGQRTTSSTKYQAGVGERGARTCEQCCHICKDGALTPVATLHAGAALRSGTK